MEISDYQKPRITLIRENREFKQEIKDLTQMLKDREQELVESRQEEAAAHRVIKLLTEDSDRARRRRELRHLYLG